MKPSTIATRVSSAGARITILALALVALSTSIAVTDLLTRKADSLLETMGKRAAYYLDQAPAERTDWSWIQAEINEARPHEVRVEIRDLTGRVRAAYGPAWQLPAFALDCRESGKLRICGRASREFLVLSALDRSDDRSARNTLLWVIGLVSVMACGAVLVASRLVMRAAVEPLSMLAARVRGLQPGNGGRVGIRSSLIEVNELAERFDDWIERFEAALAREKRFAAQASHELRTPLTVIQAEIEALPVTEAAQRALASVQRLNQLVEALLWLARAEAGLSGERMELVNVADQFREQIRTQQANNVSAQFRVVLPDEALVHGDEHLLGRICANLLDNAVKYGEGSDISVEARHGLGELTFEVTNGGPGIPEDVRSHVFEPFFRVPGRAAQGFGLGLSFARAVARAHGGDLALSLTSEELTRLRWTLPLVAWNDSESDQIT